VEPDIIVYLVDEASEMGKQLSANVAEEGPTTQPSAVSTDEEEKITEPPPRTLDELLDQVEKKSLTKKQERILRQIHEDEEAFLRLLEKVMDAPFDPEDDEAYPEFLQLKKDVIRLIV